MVSGIIGAFLVLLYGGFLLFQIIRAIALFSKGQSVIFYWCRYIMWYYALNKVRDGLYGQWKVKAHVMNRIQTDYSSKKIYLLYGFAKFSVFVADIHDTLSATVDALSYDNLSNLTEEEKMFIENYEKTQFYEK